MSNLSDAFRHEPAEHELATPASSAVRPRKFSPVLSEHSPMIPPLANQVLLIDNPNPAPSISFHKISPRLSLKSQSTQYQEKEEKDDWNSQGNHHLSPPPFHLDNDFLLHYPAGAYLTPQNQNDQSLEIAIPAQNSRQSSPRGTFNNAVFNGQPTQLYYSPLLGPPSNSSNSQPDPFQGFYITPSNSPSPQRPNPSKAPQDEEDGGQNFVTHDLIIKWNQEIGNSHNTLKAQKLIKKMCQLGGLDPSVVGPRDIRSARIALCLLAGLDNQENKMQALDGLLSMLKKDDYSKEYSIGLVDLAIRLLSLMDREVIQAVDLDAQIKLAEIYNLLAETLNQHYIKRHINAVTDELKKQLVQTAKSIRKLNRLENIELKFHIHCAIEGLHRLQCDQEELVKIAKRVYNLTTAAISLSLYSEPGDGFERLEETFADIDPPHLSDDWFDAILALKNLARQVKTNLDDLARVILFIGHNYKTINWKFSYAAVQILLDLTLHGETEEVRSGAFNQIKQIGRDFPGLASFADCNDLRHYHSYKPLIHLKRRQKIDPNVRIRSACISALREIISQSPDEKVRKKAIALFFKREKVEKDPAILEQMKSIMHYV